MPKISAPSVPEHREAQRAALIRAAEAILLAEGVAGVGPRSVTERAGLARSSFYDYFPSKNELLVAVATKAFEQWRREIEAELARWAPGTERLKAYIATTLRMAADGKHDLAAVLQQAELTPSRHEDIRALHDALFAPLAATLAELGLTDSHAWAALIEGTLNGALKLIDHGADHEAVAAAVQTFVLEGLPH
jgi:AcrR family transcriptional regulator